MSYLEHLKKDRKLSSIIREPLPPLKVKKNHALRLMASIMSQQLSTKVAKVIYSRFLDLYGGKDPALSAVTDTPFETLRGIGLSNAKANYVHNVAAFFKENNISDRKLQAMDNEAIIDTLTQIKGVGRWTVEMLLMFSLGREDVFAPDDFGIQQGMSKLYKLNSDDKKETRLRMMKLADKWSPYRTYACLHIWSWKDTAGK